MAAREDEVLGEYAGLAVIAVVAQKQKQSRRSSLAGVRGIFFINGFDV
jgi:hypothetical protein